MTWPTFPDYSTVVRAASKSITALSIVYGGASPEQLAVPRWTMQR